MKGAWGKTWRNSSKLDLTEEVKARWQSINTITSTSMRRITRLRDAVPTLLHLDSEKTQWVARDFVICPEARQNDETTVDK